jgi:hypothetical protein
LTAGPSVVPWINYLLVEHSVPAMFRKRARRQGERRLPIQEAPSPWPLAAKCGTLLELKQLAAPELCAVGAERKKAPPLDRGREAGPWGTWLDCVGLAKAILTPTVVATSARVSLSTTKKAPLVSGAWRLEMICLPALLASAGRGDPFRFTSSARRHSNRHRTYSSAAP